MRETPAQPSRGLGFGVIERKSETRREGKTIASMVYLSLCLCLSVCPCLSLSVPVRLSLSVCLTLISANSLDFSPASGVTG
jgi:hypothetical protein